MEFTPQPISKLLSQSKRKPAQNAKGQSNRSGGDDDYRLDQQQPSPLP